MIAVIDYGAGNIKSVTNAVRLLGREVIVTADPAEVAAAEVVILPGVGAAGDTARSLKTLGLDRAITYTIEMNKPMLAICVGLQVLFDTTEENGGAECLGILRGRVKKLPAGMKIPHMGWNNLRQLKPHPVYDGIPDNDYFLLRTQLLCSPGRCGYIYRPDTVRATVCRYGRPGQPHRHPVPPGEKRSQRP